MVDILLHHRYDSVVKQVRTMIRIEKGKERGPEYFLLRRVAIALGKAGKRIVAQAIQGDVAALAKIEKYAYEPKKRPAVVAWLKNHRARLKREAAKAAKAAC